MRGLLFISLSLICSSLLGQELLQNGSIALTPPTIWADDIFFDDSTLVYVSHPMTDAACSCELIDEEGKVVTIGEMPVVIHADVKIQCMSNHRNFMQSPHSSLELRRKSAHSFSIQSESTAPSASYNQGGFALLNDGLKGSRDFHNNWLGFDEEYVDLVLGFEDSVEVNKITLSTLVDHGSWIFQPSRIDLLIGEVLFSEYYIEEAKEDEISGMRFYDLAIDPLFENEITIRIYTYSSLPDWHAGTGMQGWLFLDEIIIQ